MQSGHWLTGPGISRKELFTVFFLLFNAFTWYYMILRTMESVSANPGVLSALQFAFHFAAIGSSLAGAVLSDKVGRLTLIYFWMASGGIASLMLAPMHDVAVGYVSIIFILLGISFGVGMPSCLAYLADNTSVGNRGRISALAFLLINLSAPFLMVLVASFDLSVNSMILAAWKILGLIVIVLLKPKEKASTDTGRCISFSTIIRDKSFSLYLIPWFMFCVIDALETVLLKDFVASDFYQLTSMTAPIIAGFSILLAGLLSDRIGRKRVVIYGFVSLGVAYAIIGMAPMLTLAWYFYIAIDAIAAGILWVTFLMILWGDLSPKGKAEKYYVIGGVPFFANALISSLLMPISNMLPLTAAFSLASFFLFLAVLPLMYAPETVPQKNIELQRLKGYIGQAKRIAGKYGGKTDRGKD